MSINHMYSIQKLVSIYFKNKTFLLHNKHDQILQKLLFEFLS